MTEERKQYHTAWRHRNRKRLREYWAEWRKSHGDKIREYTAKYKSSHLAEFISRAKKSTSRYRKNHPDGVRACNRKYYKSNTGKVNQWGLRWRNSNRDKLREYERRRSRPAGYRSAAAAIRRARKRAATVGDLTDIAKIYERRDWWRQWFDVVVDHTIPLSKGGTHEPRNLQIIYGYENSRKHTNLYYKPRVVFL